MKEQAKSHKKKIFKMDLVQIRKKNLRNWGYLMLYQMKTRSKSEKPFKRV